MYTIYSTTKGTRVCIYNGMVSDSRIKLIDPELTLEGNNPGSLVFSIPPNHIAYNDYEFIELDVKRPVTVDAVDKVDGVQYIFKGFVESEDELYTLSNKLRYDLLTSALPPSDWATEYYKKYYISTGPGEYSLIPEGEEPPEYAANTYYSRTVIIPTGGELYVGEVYAILQAPPSTDMTKSGDQWVLASGVSWDDIYFMYYTPTLTGWVPATSTFNPLNDYRKVTDDDYMVFGVGDFELLDDSVKPADWDARYYIDYYYFDEDLGTYTNIPIMPEPPEYEANKYYIRQWSHVPTNVIIYEEKASVLNPVERMVSVLTVYRLETNANGQRQEKEIWEGRVIDEEVDWDRCRRITAEGIFGYFNDTLLPQKVFNENTTLSGLIRWILNAHNAKVSDEKKFYIGTVEDVVNKTDASGATAVVGAWKIDHGTSMEALRAIAEAYGGYFRVDPPSHGDGIHSLSYINSPDDTYTEQDRQRLIDSHRVIEFGKNLLDFTKKWDMSQLCTAIIPLGKTINEVQLSPEDEVQSGRSVSKGYVITPLERSTYQVLSFRPSNWDTNYFDYYKKSTSTSSGYTKLTKSRKTNASAPDFVAGEYYQKMTSDTQQYAVAKAGSNYQVLSVNVSAGEKYYISTTIDKGHVAWAWYNSSGNVISSSGKATATKTYKDDVRTAPKDDNDATKTATSIKISCYGNAALSIKTQTETDDEFDRHVRITDCATDGEWHTKGSDYIANPDLVKHYGYIEKKVDFSTADTPEALYSAAKKWLTDTQFDQMSIDLEAIDMRALGVSYEGINLYDPILVISKPHGIDKVFPVTALTIQIAKPDEQSNTFSSNS